MTPRAVRAHGGSFEISSSIIFYDGRTRTMGEKGEAIVVYTVSAIDFLLLICSKIWANDAAEIEYISVLLNGGESERASELRETSFLGARRRRRGRVRRHALLDGGQRSKWTSEPGRFRRRKTRGRKYYRSLATTAPPRPVCLPAQRRRRRRKWHWRSQVSLPPSPSLSLLSLR